MILLRLALACLAAASFFASAQLPPPLAARLDAARFPQDAIAFVVQRMSDGATVLEHNATVPMQPASTLKLLTSWVALEELGPGWKGRSELRVSGRVHRGVLQGDVVLAGRGDVDLDWRELERMLRQLRLQGVREIRGDLVLDRSYFEPARTDVGNAPFDETPEFRYNVVPDALLLNSNLVDVDMSSMSGSLRAGMSPRLEGVSVITTGMALVERACVDWELGWRIPEVVRRANGAIEVRLQGDFPQDCSASTSINVIERTVFAERLFRSLWRGLGGSFRGTVREAQGAADARVVARHSSRPLAELMHEINRGSDNPITRVVYLALGATASSSSGSTAERAAARVRGFMASRGIPDDGLVLENGSGLSRLERIRPVQLAAVLRAASAGPWAPEFVASLPTVGVDGLRGRLNGSPAEGRARIKTGTLRDASGVAGYVQDEGGERYIVVAIINHPLAVSEVARPILDVLLDWVARGRARTLP